MTDLLKALVKAASLARKGRPLSAVLAAQRGLAPARPAKRKGGAKTKVSRKPQASASLSPRPAPGSFISGEFTCPQGTLAYRLYTPHGSPLRRMPLVVMLHGCSQSAVDFAIGTGMNRLADALGFIVLYPQQSQSANLARCWNWHNPDNQKRGRGEPAVIAALTRHAMALSRANPARIYIAGLSAGGAAAAITGAAYPDLFVAIGVHSGVAQGQIGSLATAISAMRGRRASGPSGKLRRPPPTIVFHGDQDRVVHPSNAGAFLANLERSKPGPLLSQSFAGTSAQGRDFTRKVYKSAHGEILLEDWTIHGSGHGWSGGHAGGSYTDPAGPDASKEMLRFFLARRRQAPKQKPAVKSDP
ncbi:extracellular catalytic domain type 1 short-chain-length polyhydroxyalkanoate depolymerase [Novosphingobium terrae]|uniref:extracellular catalytic domain type 1 short-chain-length polyhydroxyalkanoate depolymerase n=1 Tax=Novosphingobium terrae TaxID=2726189 RepID=UPI00197D8E9F|nr:PHB depolymerase family esterase [Novosphingobium terrae]